MSAQQLYCPRCGIAALVSVDNKIFGCSRCGYTYYHNTAVAVSAVVECAGRIALITRATEPGQGLFDLPGGFVEGDESLEMAVMRETFEETGIELTAPRYLFSLPSRYQHHNMDYRTVVVFFSCSIDAYPPFIPNAEALALEWRELADIDLTTVAFESMRLALARLRTVTSGA